MKSNLIVSILTVSGLVNSGMHSNSEGHHSLKRQKLIDIKNTRWINRVSSDCLNYLKIKNTAYEEYNCEMDYLVSGKFKLKGDTLILTEIDLESNVSGKEKYIVTAVSKYLIKDNKLSLVSAKEKYDDVWKTTQFNSSNRFTYYRSKN
ncbi:hypothetical protein ACXZ1K_11450 [Pedobacter sp. PWIIR3]